jgi:hypothetical protein
MKRILFVLLLVILVSGVALGQTTPGPKLLALRQAQATPPSYSVGAGAALVVAGKHIPVAITLTAQLTRAASVPVFFEALGTSDWQYGGAVTVPLSTLADPFSKWTGIVWSPGFERVLQGTKVGPAALTNALRWSDVTWGALVQWDALDLGF